MSGGYRLLLIPDGQCGRHVDDPGQAYVLAGDGRGELGPFEFIAYVGEDHVIRMSRLLYEQIEVVEPPAPREAPG